jgi:hypothetical protein
LRRADSGPGGTLADLESLSGAIADVGSCALGRRRVCVELFGFV